MEVIGAAATEETKELLQDLVNGTKNFTNLRYDAKLDLNAITILIRLSIINLHKHFPNVKEVEEYKEYLKSPSKFDEYLKSIASDL